MTYIKEKMNTKAIKAILFASLIAAMILPFSMANYASADATNNDELPLPI